MTKLVFFALMAMAVALGEAATITVGGTTGWIIPPNTGFYDTWEDTQNITVGDTLVFNFVNGSHDVARVSEADYNSCNLNSPIFTQTTSPFSFDINDTSDYYFICTFGNGNHCSRGQKLEITDVKASSTSPPSTGNGPTSSATPPPPPPPPNSAHSLASAISLVAIAIAIAVAFLG